jgi:hypothetical protein
MQVFTLREMFEVSQSLAEGEEPMSSGELAESATTFRPRYCRCHGKRGQRFVVQRSEHIRQPLRVMSLLARHESFDVREWLSMARQDQRRLEVGHPVEGANVRAGLVLAKTEIVPPGSLSDADPSSR